MTRFRVNQKSPSPQWLTKNHQVSESNKSVTRSSHQSSYYNSNKIVKNNNLHKHKNSAIIPSKQIVVKINQYVISSHILLQIIWSEKFFYFGCCLRLKHSPLDSESFHCSNGIVFHCKLTNKMVYKIRLRM